MTLFEKVSIVGIFVILGICILVGVEISMRMTEETCEKVCIREGLYPIHVSKAATCLCYDSNGILRVPGDPVWPDDTDAPIDTSD